VEYGILLCEVMTWKVDTIPQVEVCNHIQVWSCHQNQRNITDIGVWLTGKNPLCHN